MNFKSTDIYIAITTFDRKEELNLLLEDISRETIGKKVHIHIYDDNSPVDNYVSKSINIKYNLTKYGYNHGKEGYWSVMNDVFKDAQTWNFKYFFFLQDDCRLTEGFFDLAIAEFEEITDPNKATLCTFTPNSVYDRTMWTHRKAKDMVFGGKKYIKSNYVDCIFMCPWETLKALQFKIEPVASSRFISKIISSGVGQQLTIRLMHLRKTMYCAYSSLVISHSNKSKMNEEERKRNPLTPLIREQEPLPELSLVEMLSFHKEKVTIGMASIKSREKILEKSIKSLIDQVDSIHVYLNDYEKVPEFLLKNPKITFYLGKIYRDRGDTGKFYGLNQVEEGYFFSCDDDLIYPQDYVEKTVSFLNDNENKVIATYHGVILKEGRLNNYYRDRKQIHYSRFQKTPIRVHLGGTGVMAFHVKSFKPDITKFKYPNMADVWVGIQAQEKKIPIVCAPRIMNWIKAEDLPIAETIYGSKKNHDIQTDVLNDWKFNYGEFVL